MSQVLPSTHYSCLQVDHLRVSSTLQYLEYSRLQVCSCMCYFIGIFSSLFKTTSPSYASLVSRATVLLAIVRATKFAHQGTIPANKKSTASSTCLDHHL
eukprot:scaffold243200_cov66-Cyclotella_meneghiniana.AAC.3